MKNGCILLFLLVLVSMPVAVGHAAQCTTAEPEPCEDNGNGGCTAKIKFAHSAIRFDATGSCTVNVTACLVPKNQLNLQCEDVEANQDSQNNPVAGRTIQTEGQVCVSTRNKVPVYDITTTTTAPQVGCTEEEIFIFCPPSDLNISPRICQAAELQDARSGSDGVTCGVNGFWPTGDEDPISRKPGGFSDFWWCNEVPDFSQTAVFGGYRFEAYTEIRVGSTFPICFFLTDEFGNVFQGANALLSIGQTKDAEDNPVPFTPVIPTEDPGASEAENTPLYERDGNKYCFNWQTKGLEAGVYEITTTFLNVFTPQQTIAVVLVE